MPTDQNCESGVFWAIRHEWDFCAIRINRVSKSRAYYTDGCGKERFMDAGKLLPWRGGEVTARRLVEQLKSARAERDNRKKRADAWFARQIKELVGASE